MVSFVSFTKISFSKVLKESTRKTTLNLINMKVIPLEKQLSNNSSQPTANPTNHEALHTQTLL